LTAINRDPGRNNRLRGELLRQVHAMPQRVA
jgi:hypothetical protein